MVLFPDELKISSSLKKTLKKQAFEIRFNSAFRQVITACSQSTRGEKIAPAESNTWISAEMINAYCDLNQQGHAICMESWLNNQLVGGCYGVLINKMFYGESMFHTQTDASKVAFVHLVNYLKTLKIGMIDCQMKTPLLASFGGREIDRQQFMQNLTKLVNF